MTFDQKVPYQRHLKDDTFNTMSNSDLKKPKSLYSYTIKNLVKIKHSWKGNK